VATSFRVAAEGA